VITAKRNLQHNTTMNRDLVQIAVKANPDEMNPQMTWKRFRNSQILQNWIKNLSISKISRR
jgi:hypothetical protein